MNGEKPTLLYAMAGSNPAQSVLFRHARKALLTMACLCARQYSGAGDMFQNCTSGLKDRTSSASRHFALCKILIETVSPHRYHLGIEGDQTADQRRSYHTAPTYLIAIILLCPLFFWALRKNPPPPPVQRFHKLLRARPGCEFATRTDAVEGKSCPRSGPLSQYPKGLDYPEFFLSPLEPKMTPFIATAEIAQAQDIRP